MFFFSVVVTAVVTVSAIVVVVIVIQFSVYGGDFLLTKTNNIEIKFNLSDLILSSYISIFDPVVTLKFPCHVMYFDVQILHL